MATLGYYNYSGAFLAASANPLVTLWATATGPLVATGGADKLVGRGYGLALVGGAGDDTFVISFSNDFIWGASGGVDTVIASIDYALPSYIQNLTLDGTWRNPVGIGNASANIITADKAGEVIYGQGGDDVLVSAGGDTFVFQPGSGKDVIVGFHPGAANADVVRLSGYGFVSMAQVQAAMVQSGSDVILRLDANNLVDFRNTSLAAFTAENFQFQADTASLKLSFDEEFNWFSRWSPITNTGRWKTNYATGAQNWLDSHTIRPSGELDIVVDPDFAGTGSTPLGLNPFSLKNGILTITAAPTPAAAQPLLWNYAYTSGLITTQKNFSQLYGYFEIRAQLPSTSSGLWPEFWMLPIDNSSSSELDVFEAVGDQPNTIHETVHWLNPDGTPNAYSFSTYVPNLLGAFHTFGVLWSASTITWTVDGAAVGSAPTPPGMTKPMYMLANLAVGGNWPGPPTAATKFPATFQIDYIRAYAQSPTPVAITGGSGGDTYYVHNPLDTIAVAAGTLNESVIADVSYALPANIQSLTLSGSGLTGVGNALSNTLTSIGGANTLVGGLGSDTYYVNNVGDKVVEQPGQGTDLVIASVSYTAPDNVELLKLVGSGLTATANAAGHTRLTSQDGGNTLVGGAGGGDIFVLWHTNDVVVAQVGAPNETVLSGVSFTLPANVQNLTGTGAGALTLVGNDLDNVITAGTGPDTLTGGGGADTFVFAPGGKVETVTDFNAGGPKDRIDVSAYLAKGLAPAFAATAGGASITFSNGDVINLANVQAGSLSLSGAFILGGTAAVNIAGGTGNDTYYVHNPADTITVAPGTPNEAVIADVSYSLPANIQSLTVSGQGLVGTGNSMDNQLTSTGGANTLVGGLGNDTYYVNNIGDQVVEQASQGNDLIVSTVSFAAPANVENLKLVGTGLTGKASAAGGVYLVSQDGGNTLIGGAGGNDVFIIAHANDTIVAQAGAPNKSIKTYVSYSLPANVQTLIGQGVTALTLVGNGLNNTLVAAKGPDVLTGGAGADTFVFAPGGKSETVTDFKAGEAADQIDISAYLKLGIAPVFVDHGTYASIAFTNGDVIDVLNTSAANLHLSGSYIL